MAAMASATTPMMEKASAGMRDLISAFSSSEARYFEEERFSEAELRKALSDSLTERKIDAMKRILAAVSVGRDCSMLFPDVVKNVSFQSLELKKLIYIYLVQYAENNRDLALLSINSFQKDLSDRSQLVRASALRAMASIKVLEVIQLVMVSVRTASSDSQPYVRKTAAQCMTKVYAVDPDQFLELRGLLLKLMNDHEVTVVGSAIMAFHHIVIARPPPSAVAAAAVAAEGGDSSAEVVGPEEALRVQLAHLHPHFRRLCQDVLVMDAWAQQCCLDILLRYCRLFFACPNRRPAGEGDALAEPVPVPEDLAAFLKSLKLLLCSASKGVTLAAVVALCYLAPSDDLKVVTMPMLRCIRQAPPESARSLLVALLPIVEARPDLLRPSIREFFVYSFDFADVKKFKLKILERLVDETNVQLVLRELQAYVSWQSDTKFVALAVRSIAHVALKISSVADSVLRGLVKMLDSKCEVLSCEAVVALRALLQQRRETADSGLGTVLPHLARHLEDLKAPTARASVVWIIGQYQREVPRLAPDVIRMLAKTFASERPEVKQQTLALALKVWAFHSLNAKGEISADNAGAVAGASPDVGGQGAVAKQPTMTPEESLQVLPRLEAIVDHVSELASFDAVWDVRDTARALKKLRDAAKASLSTGDAAAASPGLTALGAWYCKACVGIGDAVLPGTPVAALKQEGGADVGGEASGELQTTYILGSLAQALDFPLETYRPLPGWAEEDSPADLRTPKAEPEASRARAEAPKSISSSNVGNVQHIENRVQAPSNITNMPVVSSLEDLDLFYSNDAPSGPSRGPAGGGGAAKGASGGGGTAAAAEEPRPTLEQFSLSSGRPPSGVVGTAVFGEDDESDEEEDSEKGQDEDDDDWKYCLQASQSAPGTSAPSSAPAATAAPAAPAAAAAAASEPASASAATAAEEASPPAPAAEAAEAPPEAAAELVEELAEVAESLAEPAAVPDDFFDPLPREAAAEAPAAAVAQVDAVDDVPGEPPPAAVAAPPPVEDSLL